MFLSEKNLFALENRWSVNNTFIWNSTAYCICSQMFVSYCLGANMKHKYDLLPRGFAQEYVWNKDSKWTERDCSQTAHHAAIVR